MNMSVEIIVDLFGVRLEKLLLTGPALGEAPVIPAEHHSFRGVFDQVRALSSKTRQWMSNLA
jgi:hypothetical protein